MVTTIAESRYVDPSNSRYIYDMCKMTNSVTQMQYISFILLDTETSYLYYTFLRKSVAVDVSNIPIYTLVSDSYNDVLINYGEFKVLVFTYASAPHTVYLKKTTRGELPIFTSDLYSLDLDIVDWPVIAGLYGF